MRSLMLAALACLWLGAGSAQALELKNIRNCYAPPFAGATRPNLKILAGDFIFITYDIEGLQPTKGGKLSFSTLLQLTDSAGKQVFSQTTPGEIVPLLGGTRIPGEINVEIPPSQAPGKYNIKVAVTDKESKESKSFTYPFEVLPAGFGFVNVAAESYGLIGTYHSARFALVHMKLDDKKLPKVELLMRVLDETGKELSKLDASFPKDLPEDVDLGKANFLPWYYPVYLHRTGRFKIEITAKDNAGAGMATISYPLVVIDATTVGPR